MTRRLAVAVALAAGLLAAPAADAAPDTIFCVKASAYAARRLLTVPKICVPIGGPGQVAATPTR